MVSPLAVPLISLYPARLVSPTMTTKRSRILEGCKGNLLKELPDPHERPHTLIKPLLQGRFLRGVATLQIDEVYDACNASLELS